MAIYIGSDGRFIISDHAGIVVSAKGKRRTPARNRRLVGDHGCIRETR